MQVEVLSAEETAQNVAALFEALLLMLSISELIGRYELVLLSDNPDCYGNTFLLRLPPVVVHRHGFHMRDFLHSEGGDGN